MTSRTKNLTKIDDWTRDGWFILTTEKIDSRFRIPFKGTGISSIKGDCIDKFVHDIHKTNYLFRLSKNQISNTLYFEFKTEKDEPLYRSPDFPSLSLIALAKTKKHAPKVQKEFNKTYQTLLQNAQLKSIAF